MESNLEISVLMSAFNASAHIREAIESILAQTFTNFEFIIINDGSGDETEKIILSFNDSRIVYVRNETNIGLIESLNKGLDIAKGKYIARMDADDIALRERLKEQLNVFSVDPSVVVAGSDYYLLRDGSTRLQTNVNDSDYQKTILMFATCFAHPTVMMRNIFRDTTLRYDNNFQHTEDYRLWTELSSFGKFYNVSKPLLKYRSHPNQVSNKNRALQLRASDKIRRDYLQKNGFLFSEEQFEIHALIGNNEMIRSKEKLLQVETWLGSLVSQNDALKKLNDVSFKRAIHKYWLDSCGNTNLGLTAFKIFRNSGLSKIYETTFLMETKLFVKCVLRKFR